MEPSTERKYMSAGNWHRAWRGTRKHFFLAPDYTKTACGKQLNISTPNKNLPLCKKCKQWVDENPMVLKQN